ncbi:MAG: ribose-phosphate diphosphokinase [Cyclobacteriaceae bacterium]|nr:ribose-phosphate diphosphokinase [Cyclobacteriaceae bacterium]
MENIVKLYATSTAGKLGEAIAKQLGYPLHTTQVEKFSDGELFVKFNESIRGNVIFLIGKVNMPYEHFFELLMTIDAARRSSAKEVILVIPYLPHSRQERRDGQRTAISSRMVADMIQMMGADRLITLDLHTNAIEGFYKIPVDPLSSLKLFLEHIEQSKIKNLCLCSPDFGGIKRVKQYKKNLDADMVVINKERLTANAVAKMEIIGDVTNKNVIIIDDLVDTAGTLCKAADLLIERGAKSVRAYCTHGVLSDPAIQNLTNCKIEKLFISDTVMESVDNPKIEVITCAPVLATAIENIISNKSLSQL